MRALDFILGLSLGASAVQAFATTQPTSGLNGQQERQQRRQLPRGVHELQIDRSRHHRRSTPDHANHLDFARLDRTRMLAKYNHNWVVFNASNQPSEAAVNPLKERTPLTGPLDVALAKRAGAVATAELTMDVSDGIISDYFSGDIFVGTPAQHFPIDFEWVTSLFPSAERVLHQCDGMSSTGSSDFWIPGSGSSTHFVKFNADLSTTFVDLKTPFDITYGSGDSVDGFLAVDTVAVGNLKAENQTFAVVHSDLTNIAITSFSGILGMGWQSIAVSQRPPFHVSVAPQLASKVFAFHLTKPRDEIREKSTKVADQWVSSMIEAAGQGTALLGDRLTEQRREKRQAAQTQTREPRPGEVEDGRGSGGNTPDSPGAGNAQDAARKGPPLVNAPGGSLMLGGIDSSLIEGDVVYQDLVHEAYWEVALEAYTVAGQPVRGTAGRAILDTGTSLIYLPSTLATAVFAAIGAKPIPDLQMEGYYGMPCEQITKVDLSLTFGKQAFRIDPSNLNLGAFDQAETQCILGIIAADAQDLEGQPMSIIGDAFLSSFYSVYDFGQSRVGLARLAASTSGNRLDVNSTASPATGTHPSNQISSTGLSVSTKPTVSESQDDEPPTSSLASTKNQTASSDAQMISGVSLGILTMAALLLCLPAN